MPTDHHDDGLTRDHDCVTGSLLGASPQGNALQIIPMYCHRWSCPRCRKYKSGKWRKIAIVGKPQRFMTLTLKADPSVAPRKMALKAKKAFTLLVMILRKDYGEFEYMLVWELTKAGTPHMHILQRGDFIPKGRLSKEWCALTGSYIVDIKQIKNDGHVARYITKYMGKSMGETNNTLDGLRIVQKSQGFLPDFPDGEDLELSPTDKKITSWVFCSARPREIMEYLLTLDGVELLSSSTVTCIEFRGPPADDIQAKVCYHFDEDRSLH